MPMKSEVVRAHAPRTASVRCTLGDVMLGPLPVPVMFFYDCRLEPDALAHALGRVLGDFCIFDASLQPRGADVFIDCGRAGVRFSVAEDARTMAVAMASLPQRDSAKYVDLIATRRAHAGEPVLTVRITHFADGKSVLGVCWNHTVGDMHTFMSLMRAWSDAAAGRAYAEPLVVEDRIAHCAEVIPRAAHLEPGVRRLAALEFVGFVFHLLSRAHDVRTVRFYFSPEELQALRAALQAETGKPLTTNDVLCGHMFSLIAAHDPRPRRRKLTAAVNMRKRIGLPTGLLGNMLGHVVFEGDADASASTIASDMRRGVDRFAEDHLDYHPSVDLMARHGAAKLTRFLPHGIDPKNGALMSTNWCRFGVHDVDFGRTRPRYFTSVGGAFPWINLLQDGVDGLGVVYVAMLPSAIADRLTSREGRRAVHHHRPTHSELPALARELPWLV